MRATAKRRGVRAPARREPATHPPQRGEVEQPTSAPKLESVPDDAVAPEWRDPRSDPPFNPQVERQQAHGPYEMLLQSGETVQARWGLYGTISGGRAWGWICKGDRHLTASMIEGWKEIV